MELDSGEDKLMHSVLENDKDKIDDGKILNEALNNSMSSFSPDLMFEQFVNNYSLAENIYGETLLGLLSGYDSSYAKRNIKIPEFQKEMKNNIDKKVNEMKKQGLLDKDSSITEEGYELASLILYVQELDNLVPKGLFGETVHKKFNDFGIDYAWRDFKRGDAYRDIAIKKSVKAE